VDHDTALSVTILMLAGVGLVHLLTRIYQTVSDALGSTRRLARDTALTEAAKAMSGLVGELREARKASQAPRNTSDAPPRR